jgi:hypothetical protein
VKLRTIGEGAELLAKIEPDLSPAYFARALRNFAQRKLLEPKGYRGKGRTAAALLDEEQLCRARFLSVLSRTGLQPEQLRKTIHYLHQSWYGGNDNLLLGDRQYTQGFLAYIRQIKAGEHWFFVLKLGSELDRMDERLGDLFGGFTKEPKFGPSEFKVLATIVLDANDLLGPLLRLLQETATQEGAAGPHEQGTGDSVGESPDAE